MDRKHSPSTNKFMKALPSQNSFKSLDFRSSINPTSVKNAIVNPHKPLVFFSPKMSSDLRFSINIPSSSQKPSFSDNHPNTHFFPSKSKLIKSEDEKTFKEVLSEIHNGQSIVGGRRLEEGGTRKEEIIGGRKKEEGGERRMEERREEGRREEGRRDDGRREEEVGKREDEGLIELVWGGRVIRIRVDDPERRDLKWLREVVEKECGEGVGGWKTEEGYVLIDFILTLDNWGLGFLKRKRIKFLPLFYGIKKK